MFFLIRFEAQNLFSWFAGPRDVAAGKLLMALRTGGEKSEVVFDESFGANMVGALDKMQVALLEAAKARRAVATYEVSPYPKPQPLIPKP